MTSFLHNEQFYEHLWSVIPIPATWSSEIYGHWEPKSGFLARFARWVLYVLDIRWLWHWAYAYTAPAYKIDLTKVATVRLATELEKLFPGLNRHSQIKGCYNRDKQATETFAFDVGRFTYAIEADYAVDEDILWLDIYSVQP
jgi:hypothetical protein